MLSAASVIGRPMYRRSKIDKRYEELLDGAPWLVHVSSTTLDGEEILRCSGTVIHQDEKEAWILTSHCVVFCTCEGSLYNPMPKLEIHVQKAVHLPDKGKYEGEMLYFSERYQFALLKIEVESIIEVKHPHEGSRPWYNAEVLTLARDKEMSLKVHPGKIMWQEENYLLFVNCKFCSYGIGGPVIEPAGKMIGMSCYYGKGMAIISITTIDMCIRMWTRAGHIARPMLGMTLRTVRLLDIVRQDDLSCNYKISDGFIVDEVTDQCEAEMCGIRRGNVIRFLSPNPSSMQDSEQTEVPTHLPEVTDYIPTYLPEFEDYLLNIGWEFLTGMSWMKSLKVEVDDLVGKAKRTIMLPLQMTSGSEY